MSQLLAPQYQIEPHYDHYVKKHWRNTSAQDMGGKKKTQLNSVNSQEKKTQK